MSCVAINVNLQNGTGGHLKQRTLIKDLSSLRKCWSSDHCVAPSAS